MAEPIHLVVIGAGPAGYAAAFRAADKGMQVTLIDREMNPGGVCLYRGCIPSKALLHVAKVIEESREASAWGVTFGEPKIDIDQLRAYKDKVVQKLTSGTGALAKGRKVRYLQGSATFVDSTTLEVELTAGGTETVVADKIIVATGSRPIQIPIFDIGSDRVMDSTGALDLPDIPERLLCVGGGYIGLELATVYAALGTKVTVVEMLPKLMAGADPDLARILIKKLKKVLHEIKLQTGVVKLEADGDTIVATFRDKADVETQDVYDRVLVSIGRRPNSQGFGLENTDVKITDRGFIETTNQCRTSDPAIFAVGDVAGDPMLAHKGSHEAHVAVEVIAGEKVEFAPRAIPAVVFTDPEIAWCGITEEEAKAEGIAHRSVSFPWAASGRATAIDRNDGLTKLIVEDGTNRVIGVGIVGAGAGELIGEGALAVEMGASVEDLALTIHAHPTMTETVMEAAELFLGQCDHYFVPKRSKK